MLSVQFPCLMIYSQTCRKSGQENPGESSRSAV